VAPPGFGPAPSAASVPPPPAGQPGYGPYGASPYAPYAVGPMMTPGGMGPPPNNHMGLAITAIVLGLFFAGLLGAVLGIVAVMKANQVSSKWTAGDFAGAEKAAKGAKSWSIVTIVVTPVIAVIVFIALLSLDRGL